MFQVFSWNIRHGGGKRIPAIIKVLQTHKPTIVILSEFHNNAQGHLIITSLNAVGYRCHCHPNVPPSTNSVLMASLLPCSFHIHSEADTNFIYNLLSLEFDIFEIYGVYLPHKKKHTLFPYLKEKISNGKPAIIAGDFNSGVNGIDQVGNSFWYESDMLNFQKIGYVDCFRHIHGPQKVYSWYSHQGNGFRYDHTFIHESLLPVLKKCQYLDEVRENGFSDHAAMLIELAG
ncbi:MAG: hypothetical protein R2774_04465 [Saprospiraceae bacterium]